MKEVKCYEDDYQGCIYESFEELWQAAEEYLTPDAPCANLNWPVWVEHYKDEDNRLEIGIFQQRKGRTMIWALEQPTPEQVKQVRDMVAEVWIGHIDSGCRRHAV